ncbi:occludin/ELL domain-containing protein 1 isoform X2 [Eublepharis macularius]|uniref:Occludin/ELL domain-containing protein 1 isoform X2 n=1 Tax=Eublepharis macularius TaxID=481883 RepID=A0AA97KYS3_EUBMA|nr:occludin/ELL domain-containing protein 1 isoform X2 [Eublepharis macularius]
MASEETTASGREKRKPVVDVRGDLLSSNNWPTPSWTKSSGNSWDSTSSGGLHASPDGPFPLPRSAFAGVHQGPETSSLKPVRRFIPPSWKSFFQKWWKKPLSETPFVRYSPEGLKSSPPVSPFFNHPQRTIVDREEISDDEEDGDFKKPPSASTSPSRYEKTLLAPSQGDLSTGPPSYKEKLEAYDYKYSYMKSWPGLLRLMGGLELIFGGMVFACTAAYIQKDYQWSQLYGGNLPYNGLIGGGYGYNYYGPMTPFVLVVASLAWLVTVILLGLGVTMYYRRILLDSHWWPLTEFALNLLMFLLYMAAAIAYINDVNRGGLCYSIFANNPLIVALCRVEGGQMAAIAFLFITTLLYLTGSLVCLKMWRHEAARKKVALLRLREISHGGRTLASTSKQKPAFQPAVPKQDVSGDEAQPARKVTRRVEFSEKGEEDPAVLSCAIPTGHLPKPHVIPDYVIKYPAIGSITEQEKYKAVFKDQYAEYKELYNEDQGRFSTVRMEYENKKKDPAFLEKQERCDYLKKKLTHIKAQIQAYDREAEEGSVHL